MLAQNRILWTAATCLAAIVTLYAHQQQQPVSFDQAPVALNYENVRSIIGYPETAYDAGIQGEVILDIVVDDQGNYAGHTIVDSFHPLLRIPCEWGVNQLHFQPATRNGKAVKGISRVIFQFEIPG